MTIIRTSSWATGEWMTSVLNDGLTFGSNLTLPSNLAEFIMLLLNSSKLYLWDNHHHSVKHISKLSLKMNLVTYSKCEREQKYSAGDLVADTGRPLRKLKQWRNIKQILAGFFPAFYWQIPISSFVSCAIYPECLFLLYSSIIRRIEQ
jgi:hypothetical protein